MAMRREKAWAPFGSNLFWTHAGHAMALNGLQRM